MGFFYILLISVFTSVQAIFKKAYARRGGVLIFGSIQAVAACLFFLVREGFAVSFSPEVLPYAIGFGLSYCAVIIFSHLAIRIGSMSLTSLATSYSLLIPTAYGLLFDSDTVSWLFYVGLALLVVSLLLINYPSGGIKVTPIFALFALLALVGNGLCSIFQTVQTTAFAGRYDGGFMIVALLISLVVFFSLAFVCERREIIPSLGRGAHLMVLCGIANAAVNLFVMLAAQIMDKSLMFPMISAGGIILTWLVATFIYKERMNVKQNIGMLLGIASVIFFNI